MDDLPNCLTEDDLYTRLKEIVEAHGRFDVSSRLIPLRVSEMRHLFLNEGRRELARRLGEDENLHQWMSMGEAGFMALFRKQIEFAQVQSDLKYCIKRLVCDLADLSVSEIVAELRSVYEISPDLAEAMEALAAAIQQANENPYFLYLLKPYRSVVEHRDAFSPLLESIRSRLGKVGTDNPDTITFVELLMLCEDSYTIEQEGVPIGDPSPAVQAYAADGILNKLLFSLMDEQRADPRTKRLLTAVGLGTIGFSCTARQSDLREEVSEQGIYVGINWIIHSRARRYFLSGAPDAVIREADYNYDALAAIWGVSWRVAQTAAQQIVCLVDELFDELAPSDMDLTHRLEMTIKYIKELRRRVDGN